MKSLEIEADASVQAKHNSVIIRSEENLRPYQLIAR
jgi:hypothetical protein